MEQMKTICKGMEERLADLLLAPDTAPASVRRHVDACADCARELDELRATMGLMDAWQVPDPSPFFLTRIQARVREASDATPEGWFARLRDRLHFAQRTHLRPVAALALTVLLLVGGGAYLGVTDWDQQQPAQPDEAAVVHDLQNLDTNAQLLDQLETLSDNDSSE